MLTLQQSSAKSIKRSKLQWRGWFGWRHVKVFTKCFHINLRIPEIQWAPGKEISIRFLNTVTWYKAFRGNFDRKISMIYFQKKSLCPIIWWGCRKKSQWDLLRQWYHMKYALGKLSFHKIPSEETSVFNNLMGPQNKKTIRFLETVTSYETLRGKLHQNFSQNAFTRNPFIYRFI